MKKALVVVLSFLMVCSVFAACSADNKDDEDSKKTTVTTAAVIETQEAVIKESDAINFIKNAYTEEELGLADVEKDYSLMVASSGVEVEGKKYIKVAANVMSQSDVTTDEGKPTYNFTAVGEYYISFDGKTVLMKDMKSGKLKELDNRYDEYKSKGDGTQTEPSESTAEKTTDKK